jgi:hypothetical protein
VPDVTVGRLCKLLFPPALMFCCLSSAEPGHAPSHAGILAVFVRRLSGWRLFAVVPLTPGLRHTKVWPIPLYVTSCSISQLATAHFLALIELEAESGALQASKQSHIVLCTLTAKGEVCRPIGMKALVELRPQVSS